MEEEYKEREDDLIREERPACPRKILHRAYNHSPFHLPWFPSGFI